MKFGCAALKYRRIFERPWCGSEMPGRVRSDQGVGILEIRAIVGTEIEFTRVGGMGGGLCKEAGLHDPMFMVSGFWPWVGKEHEKPGNPGVSWDDVEEQRGFRLEEEQIWQPGTGALALGAGNAFGGQVNPDADLIGIGLGVGGQEVTVSAPYFPREVLRCRQDVLELLF